MQIIHGDGDVLVPYAAAQEHHRLVPQSELVTFEANHFMVFGNPQRLATPLDDFFGRVESGQALTRAEADPERIAAAEDPLGFKAPRTVGLALIVTLILLAVATFVSEDLTCIAAGLLVARGSLGFIEASLACGAGIFFGDLLLYGCGRLGSGALNRAPLNWFISAQAVESSSDWFEKRGFWAILMSRFLPGTRLATYVAAGLLKMNPVVFTISLLLPVALWTPLLVGVSVFIGDQVFESFEVFQRYALPAFVGLLLGVWIVLSLGRSLASYRGRRLLYGSWLRKRHWEFWPRWMVYPPVVLYALWLGLRYRKLTLFTAANPGMPAAGGFHGESKTEILEALDPSWVARFRGIPLDATLEEQQQAVRDFMRNEDLEFPIVLKPDQGLRGVGVLIAENDEDVANYFQNADRDAIVQEYVGGPELAVFYIRMPGEETGQIFSVTEKVRPHVVGDGRRTLEQLILADPRAIALAHVYFRILEKELGRVPAEGEKVKLVEVGSHSGGVVCLDGHRHATPELLDTLDRIAKAYEGFYFGRFDLRGPSLERFHAGQEFKILELNGVTSEGMHIYDRQHSVFYAWRTLFEQWRLAFEVGARNRERGVRPASVLELLQLLFGR